MAMNPGRRPPTGQGDYRVRLSGLGAALKKLDPESPFYAPAVRGAFADLGRLGQAYVRTRAPRGRSGRLAGGIGHVLDGTRAVPKFVKIGYPAGGGRMPSRGGFRYPGALEGSGAYTYRSGPLRGRPTKGWLSGARPFLRTQLRKLLAQAAQRIQRAWAAPGAPTPVRPGGGAPG